MADVIEFTEPRVQSIVVTPSPAKAGESVTVTAIVEEVVIKTLYPLPFASGEIAAGEDTE